MRAWPVLLVLVLTLLPSVAAQTVASPIQGRYEDVYVVAGRAIDANGRPFAGGKLEVEILQAGVKQAAPLVATANCKGDFITSFNLREPSAAGQVRITAIAPAGGTNGTTTVPLEPFWRRSDALVRLGSAYNAECPGDENVWESALSFSARVLNRTDPYKIGETEYQGSPYRGLVRLRYEDASGLLTCPPQPNAPAGSCEYFSPDERGDVRYTFVMQGPAAAAGRMVVVLTNATSPSAAGAAVEPCPARIGVEPGAQCVFYPVDPAFRIAGGAIEVTGRGAPVYERGSPGPAVALVVATLALAAAAARSLLQRRQG